jgi:hypothetical protein
MRGLEEPIIEHIFTRDEAVSFITKARCAVFFVAAGVSLHKADGTRLDTMLHVEVSRKIALRTVGDLLTPNYVDRGLRIRVATLGGCIFIGNAT